MDNAQRDTWIDAIAASIALSGGELPKPVRCRICGKHKPLRSVAGHLVCLGCCRVHLGFNENAHKKRPKQLKE